MGVKENIVQIKKTLPSHVELVAVSKTKPIEDIMEAYHAGQRVFGENKAQEMQHKQQELPKDIQWHMIGHLQTNKVKYISSFVALIHSVDSVKILKEINKRALQNNRIINCLLQVHIAEEETKFGFDEKTLYKLLKSEEFMQYKNIQIIGLMGMATNTNNEKQVSLEFKTLKNIFEKIKNDFFSSTANFNTLSMGMTQDYQTAIKEDSTMVRVGSAIFGKRGNI